MLNLIKVNSISPKLKTFFEKDYNTLDLYLKQLQMIFPNTIVKSHLNNFEIELHVSKDNLSSILWFLKNDSTGIFSILTDIIAVDLYSVADATEDRFCVLYSLLSVEYAQRLTIIVQTNSTLPSCVNIFSGAQWLEREVSDLVGITFENSNDTRRILTDYGFFGHPLRKDFPLSGFSEVYYDPLINNVITTAVSLSQEYRDFSFSATWEI
jgi:NADH:ubiquinone oxidoreductase subunit C